MNWHELAIHYWWMQKSLFGGIINHLWQSQSNESRIARPPLQFTITEAKYPSQLFITTWKEVVRWNSKVIV